VARENDARAEGHPGGASAQVHTSGGNFGRVWPAATARARAAMLCAAAAPPPQTLQFAWSQRAAGQSRHAQPSGTCQSGEQTCPRAALGDVASSTPAAAQWIATACARIPGQRTDHRRSPRRRLTEAVASRLADALLKLLRGTVSTENA
jgi:hypothetical protein